MATNYERGRALEYRAITALRANGYYAIRSAGSKGAVDVCAIKPGQVLFIQCKKQKKAFATADWNILLWAARDSGALPVLAEADHGGPVRWWLLTGPKRPRQRTALPCEPFLIDLPGLEH